jgi:uncharacterized Ntn-hydrolase superfamily protein
VQSRVFSVGNGVLWADASAGIAATQAIVDVGYGAKALALLRKGMAPEGIVRQILKKIRIRCPTPGRNKGRQFAVMNLKGQYAAHTGPKATEWAGHKSGTFATAQGNILAGPAVVENMIDGVREDAGSSVAAPRRRARRRAGRRRRQAWSAIGRAGDRQEGLRRLAAQRHRASTAD